MNKKEIYTLTVKLLKRKRKIIMKICRTKTDFHIVLNVMSSTNKICGFIFTSAIKKLKYTNFISIYLYIYFVKILKIIRGVFFSIKIKFKQRKERLKTFIKLKNVRFPKTKYHASIKILVKHDYNL